MRTLWLVAALLFWLPPSPAAASGRAAAPAAEAATYEAAAAPGAGDQVRAAAGFELAAVREQGRTRWKTPRSTSLDPRVPAIAGPALTWLPVRADPRPSPEGAVPLCERLPYRATAPPLRG